MNKFQKINKANVFSSLGIIVLSILGIIYTFMNSGWSKAANESTRLFPRYTFILLIIVALCQLIKELFGNAQGETKSGWNVKLWHVVVFLAVGMIAFEISIHIGIAVGIFICLMTLVSLFDDKPKKNFLSNLAFALIVTIALYVVFTKVLPIVTINQILF